MKTIVNLIIIIFAFISCNQSNPSSAPNDVSDESEIVGSWKLVYASIRENDSIHIKDLSNTDFIKIINSGHFAFFNQERGTSKNFVAGGGPYTFDGNKYTETLDFINDHSFRGHVFPFEVTFKGDSLIQQGHEKVEAAGVDRYIIEKYVRITSKN